ncbi:MAG: (R)-1-hydroxy-2-aminoethylphosphonate ammonia-lyase [Acidimicrobiales bacterium]
MDRWEVDSPQQRPPASRRDQSEGDVHWSAGRARWRAGLDERTRELLDMDERYFMRQALSTPCLDVLVSAHGSVLVDLEGREVLDFHGNCVHQVGYGHPKVVAAVKAELDRLPFSPRRYSNPAAINLAAKLAELAPGRLNKVLFAPSGALAVSTALKLARHATGRYKTVSMWGSFHGASLDTISVGGEAMFRQGAGPLLAGAEHVPPLGLAERFFGSDGHGYERFADYIDYVLEVQGDVSALIAEPVRWTTVEVPPAGFWRSVRKSCDRHGVLLVFDEVPSCLGRTGAMFCCENFDVVPDILVIGKGLGGGVVPFAAAIFREDLNVSPSTSLGHYTHEKSPLGAAAALAALEVIEEERLVPRAQELGKVVIGQLQAVATKSPLFSEARGLGMYWGLKTQPWLAGSAEDVADYLLYECLDNGLSLKVGGGDVMTLCPPLNISDDELARALATVQAAAKTVEERVWRTSGSWRASSAP